MHHHDLTSRQKGYARYLLKLTLSRRNDLLAAMRPGLRKKMRDYLIEAQAERIADWDETVRSMFLRKLHRDNCAEFEKLLSKVAPGVAAEYRRAIALH